MTRSEEDYESGVIRVRKQAETLLKCDAKPLIDAIQSGEIIKRYKLGESANEIANSFGVSGGVICRILKHAGFTLKNWSRYAHKRIIGKPHEKLIRLLDNQNIDHETRKIIKLQFRDGRTREVEFDEYLPHHNLLLEVNGEYFHGKLDKYLNNGTVRSKIWFDAYKTQAVYDNMPGWYICYICGEQRWMGFTLEPYELDPSPFGDYRGVLWARENSIQLDQNILLVIRVNPEIGTLGTLVNHYVGTNYNT